MTAENQIENSMLSIAKKSVLKTLCLLFSFDNQFPKLDVAGSNPVSRSIFSTAYKAWLQSELRLNSVYMTSRLFSNWFTMSSLLSTGDCV
jgi:hypothetical protein